MVVTVEAAQAAEAASVTVLAEESWRPRAEEHAARVDALVADHLDRRARGIAHPVLDFLFTYYSYRPAQLRTWHPGAGVALAGAREYAGSPGYATLSVGSGQVTVGSGDITAESGFVAAESGGVNAESGVVAAESGTAVTAETAAPEDARAPVVTVPGAYVARQTRLLRQVRTLLAATARRPANLGCLGLHEWAMVYRADRDEVRHADWPLRLGARGTDEVVESHRISCSHFDAYRFFTDEAHPLNTLGPGPRDRADFEQPGCLHAGMDLYKHAFRLSPMVPSDLVADCFALAREIRELDMRASPYDFTGLGYTPVKIETPEGKREYAAAQRDFADRAAPLRQRIVDACDRLIAL